MRTAPLPWDHLHSGVTRRFLLKERERALSGKITEDCRYGACRNCGVCQFDGRVSTLAAQAADKDIRPRQVFTERDQEGEQPPYSVEKPDLTVKGGHYRLWYEKNGPAAFLSQLEIQTVFERAFRRARLPLSFSAGFHPMPKLSFGMALPVGVSSRAEWINVFLREDVEPEELVRRMGPVMPEGLAPIRADRLSMGKKQPQPVEEVYELVLLKDVDERMAQWAAFLDSDERLVEKRTKKGQDAAKSTSAPWSGKAEQLENGLRLTLDWRERYMSPLALCRTVMDPASDLDFTLTKTAQNFDA